MKDIGLGILDPYTVIIVLITLVLAQVLFGYQIPLDTTNAGELFVSIVMFTGYTYAARSLIRLPVALTMSYIIFKEQKGLRDIFKPGKFHSFEEFFSWLKFVLLVIFWVPIYTLLLFANFSEKGFGTIFPSPTIDELNKKKRVTITLSILERLGIFIIAFMATLPFASNVVRAGGVAGILLIILLYVIKGNFTALIVDNLATKKGEQPDQTKITSVEKEPAGYKYIQRKGNISVRVSYCAVCQKMCSVDGQGNTPKFCSLKCRQKWFLKWDKDWCIGEGKERQLINTLRKTGYNATAPIEKTILALKELKSRAALWALLAIIRDNDGTTTDNQNNRRLEMDVTEALLQIIKDKSSLVYDLDEAAIDENENVAFVALDVMNQCSDTDEFNKRYIVPLLEHPVDKIRYSAISLLGKMQRSSELFDHLGRYGELDNQKTITALKSIGQSAIPYLQKASKNDNDWIGAFARQALLSLGVNVYPDIVEKEVTCPKCRGRLFVQFPRGKLIKKVSRLNVLNRIISRFEVKTSCPHCFTSLGVKLKEDDTLNTKLRQSMENARSNTQPTTRDTISGEVDSENGTF